MPETTLRCLPASIAATGAGTGWAAVQRVKATGDYYALAYFGPSSPGDTKAIDLTGLVPDAPSWPRLASDLAQVTIKTVTVRLRLAADAQAGGSSFVVKTVQRLDAGSPVGANLGTNQPVAALWPPGAPFPRTVYDWSEDDDFLVAVGGAAAVWTSLPSLADIVAGRFGLRIIFTQTDGANQSTNLYVEVVEILLLIDYTLDPRLLRVADPLDVLLADAARRSGGAVTGLSWLLDVTRYDQALEMEVTDRWCPTYLIDGVRTTATDTPADIQYKPRLIDAELEFALLLPQRLASSERLHSGRLVLANGDGGLDAYQRSLFTGRAVTLRLGVPGASLAAHQTIFTGVFPADAEFSAEKVVLPVAGREWLWDVDLQPRRNLYDGTGGTAGPAELARVPRPFGIGTALNVTGVLVDAANKKVDLGSDHPLKAIDAKYEAGLASVSGTNDLTQGRVTFTTLPTEFTADLRLVNVRNQVKDPDDASAGTWTRVNCTPERVAGPIDGSLGTRLTATGANATATPSGWDGAWSWESAVYSVFVRAVTPGAQVKLFGQSEVLTLGAGWAFAWMVQDATTTPAISAGDERNITIVNSGDVIDIWRYGCGPGRSPHRPLDSAAGAVEFHPNTVPAAIEHLLISRGIAAPELDFDTARWAEMEDLLVETVGGHWRQAESLRNVLAALARSAWIWLGLTHDGKVTGGLVSLNRPPSLTLSANQLLPGTARAAREPPPSRVVVKHSRNHTVQAHLAGTVARGAVVAQEWQLAAADGGASALLSVDSAAATLEVETLLQSATDAELLAARLAGFLSPGRDSYTLQANLSAIAAPLGGVVRFQFSPLTDDGAGNAGFVDALIVGKTIRLEAETVELQCYG